MVYAMRGIATRSHKATIRLVMVIGVLSATLFSIATSAQASNVIQNYTDSSINAPGGITTGPDGALWFTNSGNSSIGRITTSGAITNFTDPTINKPTGMTTGPDGAMWFTNEGNYSIGRITTGGVVSNFTDPSINDPVSITSGSDGALWFINKGTGTIGRITTSGLVSSYSDTSISNPLTITAGSDGALWFTNNGNNSIGRITTSGVVSNFTDPTIDGPYGITAGPDGALWFTNGTGNTIGRITTTGTVTSFSDSSISAPGEISVGSDGALWYGNCANSCTSVGRITTGGDVFNYSDPSINSPGGLVDGPDGNMWFSNFGNNSIGEITVGVPYVVASPAAAFSGSQIGLSGSGFAAGEKVKVSWNTGLSSPKSDALCSAVASGGGTFSCGATIPDAADAGAVGAHTITATGKTSHAKATTTFTLFSTKITPGSQWTLRIYSFGFCEVQTFSTGGTFSSDQGGDQGTYTNKKTSVTEAWTAGVLSGENWSGKYSSTYQRYQAPNGSGNIPGTVTLSPGAAAGC
jgi:virginiamycin B lyase